jgi:hypothetical protein
LGAVLAADVPVADPSNSGDAQLLTSEAVEAFIASDDDKSDSELDWLLVGLDA